MPHFALPFFRLLKPGASPRMTRLFHQTATTQPTLFILLASSLIFPRKSPSIFLLLTALAVCIDAEEGGEGLPTKVFWEYTDRQKDFLLLLLSTLVSSRSSPDRRRKGRQADSHSLFWALRSNYNDLGGGEEAVIMNVWALRRVPGQKRELEDSCSSSKTN